MQGLTQAEEEIGVVPPRTDFAHNSLSERVIRKVCGYANSILVSRSMRGDRPAGQVTVSIFRAVKNPQFIEVIRRDSAMEDVLMEIVKDRVDERIGKERHDQEQETTVNYICNLMESLGVTVENAMDILKILPAQRDTYVGLVKKKL